MATGDWLASISPGGTGAFSGFIFPSNTASMCLLNTYSGNINSSGHSLQAICQMVSNAEEYINSATVDNCFHFSMETTIHENNGET